MTIVNVVEVLSELVLMLLSRGIGVCAKLELCHHTRTYMCIYILFIFNVLDIKL